MGQRQRVLVVIGTRPEAIKLAPVILTLRRNERIETQVCVTAQHRALLDQVLELFAIRPDFDLNLMVTAQDNADFVGMAISALNQVMRQQRPDLVVVQGDTSTALAAAMAAFYVKAPIAHVEAGLRSGDIANPYPEEMHRCYIGRLAGLHFAPTTGAANALIAEGVNKAYIHVTGNTVIDALHLTLARIDADTALQATLDARFAHLDPAKRLLMVTTHRRENFGAPLHAIADALVQLAQQERVEIVFPVHPNPAVRETVMSRLGGLSNVHLVEPLDYPTFIHLLRRAHLVLTDSGGVQEEAPAVGCPTLVLRTCTERPEGADAGAARVIGLDPHTIIAETRQLLHDRATHARMRQPVSPMGTGKPRSESRWRSTNS